MLMKLSRNVFLVKENDDNVLAACTLTKSVIRLSKLGLDDITRGDDDKLSCLTKKQFAECKDLGFLVPCSLDEGDYISYILNKDRLSPYALNTFVAFSTECNFGCAYCYEAGQVEARKMTKRIAKKLLGWYQRKLENGSYKECCIDLYGGEPLLSMPVIEYLLSGLIVISERLGISLVARLVTNGYLLTTNIVNRLIKLRLKEIHITLDGPPAIHNIRRPLKNGKESFGVVFENLISLARNGLPIDIVCRISFDKSNLAQIPELLDMIKDNDPGSSIYVYFAAVTQTISQVSNCESFCSKNVMSDKEVAKGLIFLYTEAKKRGMDVPSFFNIGPCMAVAEGACVIDPDGYIYKCLDMIGKSDLSIGSIFQDDYLPIYYSFMNGEEIKKCLKTDCPFVPVCAGGCVMESLIKHGDHSSAICHRKMLEEIYRDLLPLSI